MDFIPLVLMMVNLFLLPLARSCNFPALEGQVPESQRSGCWEKASGQAAMNECASQDLENADAELNNIYNRLLKEHSSNPQRIRGIKVAEKAWIAYRDAQISALFPIEERTGSIYPMCVAIYRKELTIAQTKVLRSMLEGQEGDVCAPTR